MIGALLIGLAFGFVMQRSGFCGAALLSSAVLFKDARGLIGIAMAVCVSMVGFSLLARWDLVITNPSPLRLLSALLGGLLFGIGMVLAGGCVTGSLYKAAEGRLTSMLAVVGIAIGGSAMRHGALRPLRRVVVKATADVSPPAALDGVLGLPYSGVGLVVGGVGVVLLAALLWWRRPAATAPTQPWWRRMLKGGWSAAAGGVGVGVLGWVAYLSATSAGRNYPLGGLYGVLAPFSYLTGGPISGGEWMSLLAAGILMGSALSARLRGEWALRSADPSTLVIAFVGGLMVGAGALLGRGCFIGNTVSGLALLSIHSAVFTLVMVPANWATTVLYLRGTR